MANILPTVIFPGYEQVAAGGTVTAESIVIPIADLPSLTAAEANAATGDGRKVAYGLSQAIFDKVTALDPAARPNAMSVARGTPTGVNASTVQQSFTQTYQLDVTGVDVAAES